MNKPVKAVLISLAVFIALFPYIFAFSLIAMSAGTNCRAEAYVYSPFTVLSRTDIRRGEPEILCNLDTHGGFHGDGDWSAVLRYGSNDLLSALSGHPEWRPLPLSETLSDALEIYASDMVEGIAFQGPMLSAKHGYYFFLDRQTAADNTAPKDESKLLSRYSVNFTLAVYDADTSFLYILEADT